MKSAERRSLAGHQEPDAPGSRAPPPIPPITIEPDHRCRAADGGQEGHVRRRLAHTSEGDTYTLISQEYLHDTKYAAALEAYNKDRRKAGERIIRVPPPWVLEEQFPGLIGNTDKPAVPEAKPTGNLKFEPVAPPTSGNRPAPPPAAHRIRHEHQRERRVPREERSRRDDPRNRPQGLRRRQRLEEALGLESQPRPDATDSERHDFAAGASSRVGTNNRVGRSRVNPMGGRPCSCLEDGCLVFAAAESEA